MTVHTVYLIEGIESIETEGLGLLEQLTGLDTVGNHYTQVTKSEIEAINASSILGYDWTNSNFYDSDNQAFVNLQCELLGMKMGVFHNATLVEGIAVHEHLGRIIDASLVEGIESDNFIPASIFPTEWANIDIDIAGNSGKSLIENSDIAEELARQWIPTRACEDDVKVQEALSAILDHNSSIIAVAPHYPSTPVGGSGEVDPNCCVLLEPVILESISGDIYELQVPQYGSTVESKAFTLNSNGFYYNRGIKVYKFTIKTKEFDNLHGETGVEDEDDTGLLTFIEDNNFNLIHMIDQYGDLYDGFIIGQPKIQVIAEGACYSEETGEIEDLTHKLITIRFEGVLISRGEEE